MEWYIEVLTQKYADFSGRARRSEYWYFFLFNLIVAIVLAVIDLVLGTGNLLGNIYSLAVTVPNMAVTARRLHDTGRSGWWQLIMFIPFIALLGLIGLMLLGLMLLGFIPFIGWMLLICWTVLIVFLAQDSDFGRNQYGPSPKKNPVA